MTKPEDMTKQFRKKPVVITAVQWFSGSVGNVVSPPPHCTSKSDMRCEKCGNPSGVHGWIKTLEGGSDGAQLVCPADWIITGIKGEQYPCKPEIFAATYQPVTEGAAGSASPQGDLLAALKGIKGLFADSSPFYIAKVGKPITNGDQSRIDSVFIALEAAIANFESGSVSTHGPRPVCPTDAEYLKLAQGLTNIYIVNERLTPALQDKRTADFLKREMAKFFAAAPAEDAKEKA